MFSIPEITSQSNAFKNSVLVILSVVIVACAVFTNVKNDIATSKLILIMFFNIVLMFKILMLPK